MKYSNPRYLAIVISILPSACGTLPTSNPKYIFYRGKINENHDRARIPESEPLITSSMMSPQATQVFFEKTCHLPFPHSKLKSVEAEHCEKLLQSGTGEALDSRYFAADTAAVNELCRKDPLPCMEPEGLEYLLRRSHNSVIEISRSQKLQALERWSQGLLGEAELREEVLGSTELNLPVNPPRRQHFGGKAF